MASHDDERISLALDVIDALRRRIRAPSKTETVRRAVRKHVLTEGPGCKDLGSGSMSMALDMGRGRDFRQVPVPRSVY